MSEGLVSLQGPGYPPRMGRAPWLAVLVMTGCAVGNDPLAPPESECTAAAECDDQDACTVDDRCASGVCSGLPKDADGDGHVDGACGGDDCDDASDAISPADVEGPFGHSTCSDTFDNDCDQSTDGADGGCTGQPCDGTPSGGTESRLRYAQETVPYGQTCAAEEQYRTCTDGSFGAWSGTYTYATCYRGCLGLDGALVEHGTSRSYYIAGTQAEYPCIPQPRYCDDGELDGFASAPSCVESRSRWRVASVRYPASCDDEDELQTRTCTAGSCEAWSGTYTQDGCTVACQPDWLTGTPRGGETPALVRPDYDYVPSVMLDGVYRMWWCGFGSPSGDWIHYAEADSLAGPWHSRSSTVPGSYDSVFGPSYAPGTFDEAHACDPSVIRVGGTYYLFYGGINYAGSAEHTTKIGVASSPDGFTWTRLNGGQPIISPARDYRTATTNPYGAGQPSITYLDGKFYIAFTDTTGRASPMPADNGAGVYVMRSADPTFQTGVEELTAGGFAPYDAATHTGYSLNNAFSVDWQFVDALDTFAMAISRAVTATGPYFTEVVFYTRDLSRGLAGPRLPGSWADGPGIVSRPDKHAVPSASCGVVPLDVMRAVGSSIPTWDLAPVGADLVTGIGCECMPWERIYDGCLLQSPGLPLALARNGVRLNFALLAPALRLSNNVCAVPAEQYNAIPYGASLYSGNAAYYAPGTPGAFLLDGPGGQQSMWPISCAEILTDNNSSLAPMTTEQWYSYGRGPDLFCVSP